MTIRIPKNWLFDFCEKLLREANVPDSDIEDDLESLIYESGERGWEEYENGDGETIYIIDEDYD